MGFRTEQILVESFLAVLEQQACPWGKVEFSCEFDYLRGRVDVIAVDPANTVIAFEAKLKDWKSALHQAYRNTCFAHQSYVVLPKSTAFTALSYLAEFEKRGVGLCYVDSGSVTILQASPSIAPLEPWLAAEVVSMLRDE